MTENQPLKTFIIYARDDKAYKDQLLRHLRPLVKRGYLEIWHDGDILPGEDWGKEIKANLKASQLVLVLVSVNCLNSEFIETEELETAVSQLRAGHTRIVPIIISPCVWELHELFAELQGMPKDMKPVNTWPNLDQAWTDVVESLAKMVEDTRAEYAAAAQKEREAEEQNQLARHAAEREAREAQQLADRIAAQKEAERRAAALEQERLAGMAAQKAEAERLRREREAERKRRRQADAAGKTEPDRRIVWGGLGLSALLLVAIALWKYCNTPKLPVETPARTEQTTYEQAKQTGTVLIHGGTFSMGDQFNEGGSDEKPVHDVTVSDFYMSKYEVSFDEYDAFCTATGRDKPGDSGWGRDSLPVINVDWYDAVEYCNWRSRQEKLSEAYTIDKSITDPDNQSGYDTKKWKVTINPGAKGYRLPTEAEWEYAAREGGKKVRFGNGRDVIDPGEINFDASSSYKNKYSVEGQYREKTVAVDALSANSLGLKNMSGNVWEWCFDWYGEKYYGESKDARNPTGSGSGSYRVLRGGSWFLNPEFCRAASRVGGDPSHRDFVIGFRVVRGY